MDLDSFVQRNEPTWRRLDTLVAQAGRAPGRLSAEQLGDLVRAYQRTATHLSYARTQLHDEALVAELSRRVAAAGAVVYGTRPRSLAMVGRFVTETFPAALWHLRWHVAVSAAAFVIPAVVVGVWLASTPAALSAAIPPALQKAYIAEDFVAYYSETPSAQFFAEVGFNNVRVGVLAFAAGITFGLGTLLILLGNALNVGAVGGLFHAFGVAEVFWGFILPHGLLELTAVFVAGGTGFAMGWSLVDPGDRPRAAALGDAARRAIVVVVGLIGVFAVAAGIEGFVTGSPLPTWARLAVGVAAEAAFLTYWVVLGRRAARAGLSGRLEEADRPGWARLTPTA